MSKLRTRSAISSQVRRNSVAQSVAAQPGRDPHGDQKYMQDDPQWEREVRGATEVLEDLLKKWKEEPYVRDHVQVGCASLDELAPRLRLECVLGFRIQAELESSPL
ncbi:hypothetical protein EDB89DRAFT_1913147 [Lactarius sanguifluus]|nr:hypothetical protein EDB89DRAFT_1913147 [Lactarius sanguifluus]